jgi:4-hydroxybenzoyl-CoA reductase subunit gamma
MKRTIVSMTLNGQEHVDLVGDNVLLLDYLRDELALTGTKTGCDGGECGACTVLVDGEARFSCLSLAASCDGKTVETIESLNSSGALSDLQLGFHQKLGSQCGYCTPGFIMAAEGLLRKNSDPDEGEIKEALASNICRCTGYVKIIEAVKFAAEQRRGASQ